MTANSVQVFKTAGRLLTGSGASNQLFSEMCRLNLRHPLIVTDKGVLDAGLIQPIVAELKSQGITGIVIYSEISAEPETHVVESCRDVFINESCDGIIGIGGGSAMDTAKAVAVYQSEKRALNELFGENNCARRTVPLICLPTTAGTGSEVTNISILSDVEAQLKKGIVSDELLPDVAIVAPELTQSCPPSVTAASGIDALVHAVESYISNFASDITRALSVGAIKMIVNALPDAYRRPDDLDARERMATGSLMAGLAFGNAGVGAVHALAYPLGGRYHLSHGVSNALMFTHVMRWNLSSCPNDFLNIALAMGAEATISEADAGDFVIEKLESLCRAVEIPGGLREFGIERSDLRSIAEAASGVTRLLRNNPRELSVDDIEAIYQAAY
ncbi:UNVERIFIED_ORG: alcohol dehydrogenase class IV [Idiomarina abyssalis]|jgi:alcohol dehydrogenase class IV|uniref:iron-containing alcohol dehydrogenase n=1 Tax=Idiomarina TaxID=135575 RepID=UPI0002FD246D|nr:MULTISPECIES: iron-containing alcohol dehydrogenase [Idiomarina]AGM36280.1 alcohol dehydrogenase [Idiomarina loihiensis GSL 199]MAA61422.1 alcohol dehydrogenase [Idiomarina sp.]MBL4856819.1 iron-containing alcohol dehydrogenase [Idiomarina sp.]TDO53681.1 alcohol dehydrogenase class IV [Idiomarina sp. 017G]